MVGTRSSVPISTPAPEDIFPDSQLGTQSTSTMESSQSHQQNQPRFETAPAPFNTNDSRPGAPGARQVNPTPNYPSHPSSTAGSYPGTQHQAPFQGYQTPYGVSSSVAPNGATSSFAPSGAHSLTPNQGPASYVPTPTTSELSARINQVQEDLVAQITALKKDILDRLPHPVQASQNLGQLGPQQMAGPLHDYVHGQSQQQGEPPLLREIIVSRLGIPAEYIRKIFNETFKPMMLSKLVLNSPSSLEMEQDIVRVEDGQVITGTAQPSMKSFGSTIQIWLQGFENYLTILCQIHGAKEPGLLPAMISFKQEVEGLSRIYKLDWVLKMALTYHATLIESGVTNPGSWRHIPQVIVAQFCNPNTVKPADPRPTKPTSQSGSTTGKRPRRYCYSFQKESGCSSTACEFPHVCQDCGGNHSRFACRSKKPKVE